MMVRPYTSESGPTRSGPIAEVQRTVRRRTQKQQVGNNPPKPTTYILTPRIETSLETCRSSAMPFSANEACGETVSQHRPGE